MTNKYEVMFEWIRQNGGYIDEDLFIHENESEERIVKTKKRKENVDLITIPKKCCIEGDNQLEIMKNILKEISTPNSFYKPYLDTLPLFSSFSNCVFLNFEAKDVSIIKTINEEAGFHFENQLNFFGIVKKELNCSENMAKYIFLLCTTRSWSTGFVPLVDLMQHSESRCNIQTLSKAKNDYKISALKIGVNEEVINCYRNGSFIEMFVNYNIPFGNKDDFLKIYFQIDDALPEQIEFLKKNNLYSEPMYLNFNEDIVLLTLQKARILTQKNLFDFKEKFSYYKGFCSVENDKEALKYIFMIIKESMIFESDERLSEKYKVFENISDRFNEILVKSKQKYCDFWLEYLNIPGNYIQPCKNTNFKIDHIFISHYTKLTERKTFMEKAINEIKLKEEIAPIIWVDFFDRENLTQSQTDEYVLYRPGISHSVLIPAQISVTLGHYFAIEKIANDPKIEIGMIIEDDIIFRNDFVSNLKKVLNCMPSDWDIFCIGGGNWLDGIDCSNTVNVQKYSDSISVYKPNDFGIVTGNYLINKRSARQIMSHPLYKPFSFPIDWTLIKIARSFNMNVYWSRPFLSFEGSKKNCYEASYTA